MKLNETLPGRWVGLALALVFLSGCTPETNSVHYLTPAQQEAADKAALAERVRALGTKWDYYTEEDSIGNGTVKRAIVNSTNEVEFGSPYEGAQRGTLEIRQHPRYGKNVILSIRRGQFLCRTGGCSVTIQFDDQEYIYTYEAVEPASGSTTSLFINGYAAFLQHARKARRVRIEAQFFQESPQTFEFDVSGLKW